MAKDVIIGCYTNYDWEKIKFWANSIEASGFDGTKIMIVMNSDKETVKKLLGKNFMVIAFQQDENRYFIEPSPVPVHVERFFHIWHLLHALEEKPRYVITTDVKDVIFQTNPSEWLEKHIGDKKLVIGSEAMLYRDEPWGDQNLKETFGEYFHGMYKDQEIYNVGTIAGEWETMKDLALMIFQLSLNRPIPITDQSTFNMLMWQKVWSDVTLKTKMSDGWAAQLGTVMDPNKIAQFKPLLLDIIPEVRGDEVYTYKGEKFCIVHQYDRVPGLKEAIEAKYA